MTSRFFACFFTLLIVFGKGFAQKDDLTIALDKDSKRDTKTFNITALNGVYNRLKIAPDYNGHVLTISTPGDKIEIVPYWGCPPEVSFLNKNFIAIKYCVRGGSGFGLGNILILCVNNKKIRKAFFALNYTNSVDVGVTGNYKTSVIFKGNSEKNFQLVATVNDKVSSKALPERSFNYHERTILHFDEKLKVFYSIKKQLYGSFTVGDNKNPFTLNGYFPVVMLGTEDYYFINSDWYEITDGNHLDKFE